MPTVSGNTLTWPDDGWYQVQRADTFETVCEGSLAASAGMAGGPCVIESGSYVAINHSSGERFEDIRAVSGPVISPFAPVSTVSVEGSTISWPNDGWYQVQNIDTFATVCEGGTACDVEAGNYVVINHTTGERYSDIRVGDTSVGGGRTDVVDGIVVDGLSLSWADDGWYQVQNLASFSTVCEGGTGCSVEPGTYVIINHSTGERFNDIVVGGVAVTDPTVGTPATAVVVEGSVIAWPADGWYQVQNADSFETVCEGGLECTVPAGNYVVINHTSGERTSASVSGSGSGSGGGVVETTVTSVYFDITVPVYVSDALQVQISWGDTAVTAGWIVDETWGTTVDLPADVQNTLVVTFVDRNGELVLGRYEANYRTSTASMDTVEINADQFTTASWDDDEDGVSNLSELLAGTDPLVASLLSESSIRVNFGIIVPAYVSDELRVKLVWGDREIDANWAGDEVWTAYDDLPTDVEQPLVITFYDRNGDIELGIHQTTFRTGTNESEYIQFEANRMNTNWFDDDVDGRSNFYELSNGTDPLVSDTGLPLTYTYVQERIAVSCGGCHVGYRDGFSLDVWLELDPPDYRVGYEKYVVPFEPNVSYLIGKMEGDGNRFYTGHSGVNNRSTLPQLVRAWIAKGALDN